MEVIFMLKNRNIDTIDGIVIVALFCAFWVFYTFMCVSAMEDNTMLTRICAYETIMTVVSCGIMGHKIQNEED
jgi:hypothetical protein